MNRTCRICCRHVSSPFRVFDAHGRVTMGCVGADHDGQLVAPSESARWHSRKEAKAARKAIRDMQAGK